MSSLSEAFENPLVEIAECTGGYVWTVRIPKEDEDGEPYEDFTPHVSADLDTMLIQIKRLVQDTQHEYRKNGFGETDIDEPAKPVKVRK